MELIGTSKAITEVKEMINHVAKTLASVLIFGESGTGKELIAKNIHINSNRANASFIAINCGAIPSELLESELFGHEKGAFTGAVNFKQGKFEVANFGSIFLDEIGDMPLLMQVKLLRVLQEKCFERVGGIKTIKSDVRVIAASNQNLEENIKNGKFREDLFYRLNVFPINIPALRERVEDIPLLVDYYLEQNKRYTSVCKIHNDALEQLIKYPWPGNVRELTNIIERLCILYPNQTVHAHQLPDKIIDTNQPSPTPSQTDKFSEVVISKSIDIGGNFNLKNYVADIEISLINRALREANNVVATAANLLGIKRTTLVEKMKKLNISRQLDSNIG